MTSIQYSLTSGASYCGLYRLDDVAKDWSPPGPGEVRDHVTRVGDEWGIVGVELARLVRRTSPLPAWTHKPRVC